MTPPAMAVVTPGCSAGAAEDVDTEFVEELAAAEVSVVAEVAATPVVSAAESSPHPTSATVAAAITDTIFIVVDLFPTMSPPSFVLCDQLARSSFIALRLCPATLPKAT
ncbi:MAG: hypothetical protein JHC70_03600 [Rhodococcus sp.]|nr:hypothetical protein [Rhodococcus sp. (in: high G+C Gram-positive bacteria)]MBJ7321410.1 hypothetical protein [Rhodococcus sp. (in: high G+C Gram-positive bacteria)]